MFFLLGAVSREAELIGMVGLVRLVGCVLFQCVAGLGWVGETSWLVWWVGGVGVLNIPNWKKRAFFFRRSFSP